MLEYLERTYANTCRTSKLHVVKFKIGFEPKSLFLQSNNASKKMLTLILYNYLQIADIFRDIFFENVNFERLFKNQGFYNQISFWVKKRAKK